MPAKQKYLSGAWQRFSKIIAAIPGAYIATMLLHVAVAKNMANDTPIVLTTAYSAFLMWVGFMVLVFFIKKAWHAWALLLGISSVSSFFIFF